MDITVNQQKYTLSENCSLQELIATVISQPANGIAIAVNQEIVAKANWGTCVLKSGDHITIIKATQGG